LAFAITLLLLMPHSLASIIPKTQLPLRSKLLAVNGLTPILRVLKKTP